LIDAYFGDRLYGKSCWGTLGPFIFAILLWPGWRIQKEPYDGSD
jgi:hypothetical protein